MLFGRKREEKKVEVKQGRQIGDRIAIKYGSLSTCISYIDEHPYHPAIIQCNMHNLPMGQIASLWTVLEYIGNNQYIDLVSGEIIGYQTDADSVLDTVTLEYEDRARSLQERLLESPIAIGSFDGYGSRGICQLTPEIKKMIMEETMPRQEEIISTLSAKKEEARSLIMDFYAKKNRGMMHRYYNVAVRENEEFDRRERERRLAEERRRKEEEERRAAERFRAEIDPKFDAMFPPKRLIKK